MAASKSLLMLTRTPSVENSPTGRASSSEAARGRSLRYRRSSVANRAAAAVKVEEEAHAVDLGSLKVDGRNLAGLGGKEDHLSKRS